MQAICRRVYPKELPLRRSDRKPRKALVLEVLIKELIVPIDLNNAFRPFFPTIHPHRADIITETMPREVTLEEVQRGGTTSYRIVRHDLAFWAEKVRTHLH